MADHPAAEAYRRAFEMFSTGDPGGFAGMLADDVVWHQIGAETLHGAAAVAESMSGMDEIDFSVDLHDVVANDQHLVALVTATVKVADKSIEYRTAEIAHYNDEGKVTERWAFSDDTQAIAEFFSQF